MKEEQSKPAPEYLLGSPEQQSWMKKYFFSPRGLGFLEPGIVGLDDAKMSAYNVAKSSYQIRPDVFNMNYLSKTVGLGKEEIIQRMQRMYEQRTIVFVMNPAVSVYGWGLYYWMVKLNENTPPRSQSRIIRMVSKQGRYLHWLRMPGGFRFLQRQSYEGN
ncbi:MAG TPA: hypothetical protein DEB10_07610 [Ruminococcaceae bacterium]|jgi:hypothetical protein|nr:hypothetical protein [Oscillospiraceae bacterium]